jgi:hypothetical protein
MLYNFNMHLQMGYSYGSFDLINIGPAILSEQWRYSLSMHSEIPADSLSCRPIHNSQNVFCNYFCSLIPFTCREAAHIILPLKLIMMVRFLMYLNYYYILNSHIRNSAEFEISVYKWTLVPTCFIIFIVSIVYFWPPLWSGGQSSWLQMRRPGFDSRHYQEQK